MKEYRADLHIHTILSPCGDLNMSPANIIRVAVEKQLDIIGITDHNAVLQAPLIRDLAKKQGLTVLCGAEVTTREEIHCLAFFPTDEELFSFQQYLEKYLPHQPNDPDKFGYQVVVDEAENIVREFKYLLISGIDQSLEQVEAEVHRLNGLFIPAHVDRPRFSIISQLGFFPPDLRADAFEISRNTTRQAFMASNPGLKKWNSIQSSDAHFLNYIGTAFTTFLLESPNFVEIKMALKNENGRKILTA